MSDNRDKPEKHDPDATVMMPGGRPAAGHDPDATVMMPSSKVLANPDEDATVMMRPGAAGESADADATVMMPAGLGKGEPPTPERVPLAAFQRDDDPDATVIGTQPPPEPEPAPAAEAPEPVVPAAAAPAPKAPDLATPVSADTSRMPLIAGGVVVIAVALYFVFGGGKAPAPVAPKPEVPAAPAPAATPAPAVPVSAAPAATPAPAPAPAATAAPTTQAPAAKQLLAGEVKRGLIAVAEEGGVTTITLHSTNQFASGGVDIESRLRPVVLAIGAALDKAPGTIVVTGHADAKPSSNPKFPTNQALSAARAESVAKLIEGKLRDPKRVKSEGAGDSQQVAPSDTAENRAKNRRVVIVLRPAS